MTELPGRTFRRAARHTSILGELVGDVIAAAMSEDLGDDRLVVAGKQEVHLVHEYTGYRHTHDQHIKTTAWRSREAAEAHAATLRNRRVETLPVQ